MTNSEYIGSGNNATVWGKLDLEGDYLISIDGQVMSTKFGKEKLLKLGRGGYASKYLNFSFREKGKQRTLNIHKCVGITFLGDRSSEGLIVLHGKKGSLDNSLENISWGTYNDNNGVDRLRDGNSNVGRKHKNKRRLTAKDIPGIRQQSKLGWTQKELAILYGVSQPSISCVLLGKTWGSTIDM